MLKFAAFDGINNVVPENRLRGSDLVAATDVDIGLTGEVLRRAGFTSLSSDCHKNLHQGRGFMLATTGSTLVAIHPGGVRHTLYEGVGPDRVWYCNLPDGRTTFSNGLAHGITDGMTAVDRNVPAPSSPGVVEPAFGGLFPGLYRHHLTYTRMADRVEGPTLNADPVQLPGGGFRLDGLPELEGHVINVYLSSQGGEEAYLAGTTAGSTFEFSGTNAQLTLLCRTLGALPFPTGTITAYWRGRVLVAQGDVLWASRPNTPHLSDWRDFKRMPAQITAIQPVKDGIYVGTTDDLYWLGGETFDGLTFTAKEHGGVVLGSGVSAPGQMVKMGEGAGTSEAMICIAGGNVVAGFNGGQTFNLTKNRYTTGVTEVAATFREVGGIPQYVAVPQ